MKYNKLKISRKKKKKISNSKLYTRKSKKKKHKTHQVGGAFLFKKMFSCCLVSGKAIRMNPDEIKSDVDLKFLEKFNKRIRYFEDETIYNENIVAEANELLANTAESQTYGIMEDINFRVPKSKKAVHTVSLHGYMITEELHKVLPHNVILCNIASPKRANINFNDRQWSIHKFFQVAPPTLINQIFQERTLHSIPDNFKLIKDVYKITKESAFTVFNSIECFKKASWYYPFQKYYDINLVSGETSNKRFDSYFGRKTRHIENTYKNKKKITLSRLINELSKASPDHIVLVLTTSCQPFDLGDKPDIRVERTRLLNNIFKYMAIMYDLNLSLDETLLQKLSPGTSNPKVVIKSRREELYCMPFCQTINERSINILSRGDHTDYYFTSPFVNRSHNLDRDYPFFAYIEEEIADKVLSKKVNTSFAGFIENLSFSKKLTFYHKLCRTYPDESSIAKKNINRLIIELRRNSNFVSYSLNYFNTLYEVFGTKFSQYQGEKKEILEEDLSALMEVLKILYFQGKYSKSDVAEVNESLQIFFLGKSFKDMVFYYSQIFSPSKHSKPKKVKKLKLLKCKLTNYLLNNELLENFSNVTEFDFQDLQCQEDISFSINKKMTHLTFINCLHLKVNFPPSSMICRNMAHLYLDNVKTNSNLILTQLPLVTLVIRNLPNLKILDVSKMKLKYFKIQLTNSCRFSVDRVEAEDFCLGFEDLVEGELSFYFQKFKPKKIIIPDSKSLNLYIDNVIPTEKTVPSVIYLQEVPSGMNEILIRCIIDKKSIWGRNTTFVLDKESNLELYGQIATSCKKYLGSLKGE